MGGDAAYDENNVFARILRGDLPCHKVFEDEHTLAFMDIMPRADGHALVIPKNPSRNILDVAARDLERVILTTQKVARAARSAFAADGVTVQQFSETAGGQVVFHLHFHVLPRHEGIELRPPGTMAPDAVIADHAEKLRRALASA